MLGDSRSKIMSKIHLSKSHYCRGVQCEKILWLEKYRPDSSINGNDAVLEKGREVGELAKGLFGEYEDIPFDIDLSVSIEKTDELLKNKPNVITEASFSYENNFCSVDILKNDVDGVEIYEVKSSTKIDDVYIDDVSYQYFVLSNLGLNVKKVSIVYINNEYIRGNELELDKLFKIEDVTFEVLGKQAEIKSNIEFLNEFMKSNDSEPVKDIGMHCLSLTSVLSGITAQKICQSLMFLTLQECLTLKSLKSIMTAKFHLKTLKMKS